jgi:outer membrane lipoprotein carrier protein
MQTLGLRSVLALVAAFVAASGAAAADADCASEIAGASSATEKVRDLAAHFEQTTQRVALGGGAGDALVASGEVVFAKPGKMRWSYASPEPSLVVSDGTTLWIYDPRASEAQKLPLGEGYLSAAGVQFLLVGSCSTSSA